MDQTAGRRYQPHEIEQRRQAAWRAADAFKTPAPGPGRAHIYIKPSAPFTSGNVHIGHVRSYSIGDAYARFRRARGDDVLFAFGFDAFGLPAELAAIAAEVPPASWVAESAEHMTGQLERLGFSFDWERSFMSSDPEMYRWSQWLFLVLLEAGMIYRGTGNVDWCDNCQTTLASIQVEPGGTCWRCHGPVRLIELPQWYWRISTALDENDARLRERAASGLWDEVALASQEIVLGRVDGVECELREPAGDGLALSVFTPHPDALARARFVLVSSRHPDVEAWASDPAVAARLAELRTGGWERSAREAETIPLVETGRTVSGPAGGELPVVVSPLVDSRFGPTAVLGIPSADRADEVVAERLGLESEPEAGGEEPGTGAASVTVALRPAVRYRAYDFAVSRQRPWGTPIPIVYCDSCGTVPVPREQLPILLPLDLVPTGAGNPLAEDEDFVNAPCPRCGGAATRETDTLDCHFDALWLWVPVCVPPAARADALEEIFALQDLRYWLPCERVVAGSDSGNFVFDQRTVTKELRDIGPLDFLADGEPFAGCLFHEMVISDGRKMSKHLGNVVDPDELVERYGADTVRLAVLYAARPQRSLNWSDSAVLRCHRYLTQVYEYTRARVAAAGDRPGTAAGVAVGGQDGGSASDEARDKTEHFRRKLLEEWCPTAVQRVTADMEALEMHTAVRDVMRLFDRIKDFEKRVRGRDPEVGPANSAALLEALALHAQLLAPLAPHLSEELLDMLGEGDEGGQPPWPGVSLEVAA